MKYKLSVFVAVLAVLCLIQPWVYAGEQSTIMKIIIEPKLPAIENLATQPLIVQAVKEQNAENQDLEQIKKLDAEWINGGLQEFSLSLQQNEAGTLLKKYISADKLFYTEAFLCDRQGAIVGEYPRTTDYWQGDEEKFTAAFGVGEGKFHIGPLEYDESSRTYAVQLSMPVRDEGKTIGVLVVGIRNIK